VLTVARADRVGEVAAARAILVAGGVAAGSVALWVEAHRRARGSLVIEASVAGGLRVTRPALIGGRSEWAASRIWDLRALTPFRSLGGGRLSAVVIVLRGGLTSVKLMEYRDAREVRWVVRELRAALGMPPAES
jgi:hypothetical protein